MNEVTISEFDPSEQDISINNVFEVYKEGYKHKFIKKTTLITPNIPEAEILTNQKITSKEDMINAGKKLLKIGA